MRSIRISAHVAKDFFENLFGLLVLPSSSVLLLKTRWGIHTIGLKRPIDVLILDDMFTVVKRKERLLPNRVYFWPPKYSLVLELPDGYIQKHSVQKGDKVDIISEKKV